MTTTVAIPDHVPTELVRDFDYVKMDSEQDPFLFFKKLHDGPDIFYSPYYGGHWVVTRYEDMNHILFSAKEFSNRHTTIPKQPVQIPLSESDGQIHADYRALLRPFFTPKATIELEKKARALTISLIEGFYSRGECEFADEFALKMPIIITMNLLDLPLDDTPFFLSAAEGILHAVDPELQQAAFMNVFGYLAEKVIPQRRANPGADMISTIVHGKVEGGRSLDDGEILGLCVALIAGGLDTVANMLSFITLFLANNPNHRQQLIDKPELIDAALDELMRRHHIGNFTRVVINDMDYKGVKFKAGDIVMAPTTLAGLDEKRYPNAMEVDFERGEKRNLVFGRGPHQCIGVLLARAELKVFLEEWLKRIPHFKVKDGEEPITAAEKVNCVRYLPICWAVQ